MPHVQDNKAASCMRLRAVSCMSSPVVCSFYVAEWYGRCRSDSVSASDFPYRGRMVWTKVMERRRSSVFVARRKFLTKIVTWEIWCECSTLITKRLPYITMYYVCSNQPGGQRSELMGFRLYSRASPHMPHFQQQKEDISLCLKGSCFLLHIAKKWICENIPL